MYTKLRHFLEIATESSPIWLDRGENIAYIRKDNTGTRVWKMNIKTGERLCLTDDMHIRNLKNSIISGDIYFSADNSGSECEQIYKLSDGHLNNVTQSVGARHFLGGIMPDGKTIAYACNLREARTFDIWKKNIETNESKLIKQHSDNYNWPCNDALSPNGRYILYNKLKSENDNALWMTDMFTGKTVRIPNDNVVSAETEPAWKHDSKGFYLLSDRDSDFIGVYYYDVESGILEHIYSYEWDATKIALSGDDKYLSVTVNAGGYSQLHIYDIENKSELNFPRLPKCVLNEYDFPNWSPEGHKLLLTLSNAKMPDCIWLLDIDAEKVIKISQNSITEEDQMQFVEPTMGSYTSFDGLTVPYWLYVPYGKECDRLPVVIEIHGGPEGQEIPSFNAFIQYIVSEGIAVVTPNVRGSTGYGKAYSHLDDVEKRLDSVQDIESLVAYLIDNNIAEKSKIAVTGTSYGGFMTLSCAARYPDIWACAIDTVGMYDLVTFLENTAEYRRAHRESEYGSLAKDYDILKKVSPVAKISDLKAPIMIIQGRNDPRVPVTEAEQAVAALKKRGCYVEYLCYDDEGHGIAKLKNKLDCYSKMVAFLKKYLC